jgi:molybdate transport system substrate-binding protein
MKYRFLSIVVLAVIFIQTGCSTKTSQKPSEINPLTVFAAGSLLQPFSEIASLFEAQHPGVKVEVNFENANALAQQIKMGAPADVFASAAEQFMTTVVNSGQVNKDDVKIFALNKLAIIFPKNNPAKIQSLADLARPGIKLVMGAKEGPQGIYVENFLSKASQDPDLTPNYKEDVYKNIVSYEDTVNSVVTKVTLGEADAGFVFFSDSQGKAAEKVDLLVIPDKFNIEAHYPIAILKDSKNLAMAKSFVDFVLSPTGQEVLKKYGFLAP